MRGHSVLTPKAGSGTIASEYQCSEERLSEVSDRTGTLLLGDLVLVRIGNLWTLL